MSFASDLDDDDNLEIELEDDRPEEDRRPPRDPNAVGDEDFDSDDEIEGVGEKVNKRIQRLRYEFHEQKRQREDAERLQNEAVQYAQQMQKQNEELRQIVDRGEKVLVAQIKQRTTADIEAAKQRYKAAIEDGDVDEIVQAQEALAESKYEQVVAGTYENQSAQNAQMPQREQQFQQQPQQQPQGDPRAAAWASKNEWFGRDKEMTFAAYGVHERLVESGVSPLSDEYYSKIDETIRRRFPEKFGGENGGGEPSSSREQRNVVAPGKRVRGGSRKVKMTPTQIELSKRLGITPEAYAKAQLALKESN